MMPNIVVIQTDDHAQWALGCYGNSEVRTPTLDHLAATGVRMRNAFTPSPVCSPARASFWTGRLPSQHGMHDYLAEADPEVAAVDWLAGETTLAQLLHDHGYVTGLSGKWHIGRPECRADGFDYWFSQSLPTPKPYAFESPWPQPPPPRDHTFNRHRITDHAVDFLRQRGQGHPFFLYVGHFDTHSPWSGHSERLVSQYRRCTFADIPDDAVHPFGRLAGESLFGTRADRREALAQYYAAVSQIDEQVGRVLDELEAQDLLSDTLVVYTSDHGLNTGHHGIWGKGNGTRPYNMVEESIRVPLILNHPGTLLGGQVRDEMVTHLDLFQTILAHAGATPGESEYEQLRYPGRSFRGHCLGDARDQFPDEVFGEYGNLRMVRDRRYKLIRRYPDGPSELFDLDCDPRETQNLIEDPAFAAMVEGLSARLDAYFETYEESDHSGLRVTDLPRHNDKEAWRDSGEHRILETPSWLAETDRRGDFPQMKGPA